ncbi:MAG: TraB/GumN family protein [Phenylobacterium sp.]
MKSLKPLLAAVAAGWALTAAAQTPAPPAMLPADPDAVLVEELVVTARLPGPAWWRVSDADSTVYVLGVPSVATKHLAWDRSVLERRLAGANTLIVSVDGVKVRPLGAPGAAVNYMRLRSGGPFEKTLSGPSQQRFVAQRTAYGKPAKRYATGNALGASLLLIEDWLDAAGLTTTDPSKPIRRLAQSQRIKVVEKAYDAGPLLGAVLRSPRSAGMACLEAVLDQIDAGPGQIRAASRAWAEGDVRGALAADRTTERCLAAAPGAAALDARFKADQAALIADALKRPGHSVAIVQLRPLLSQGGVLDRLRSQGFEVKTPGE